MRQIFIRFTLAAALAASPAFLLDAAAGGLNIQLGPRPYYLIEKLEPGELKTTLQECADLEFMQKEYSIGHRGGADVAVP